MSDREFENYLTLIGRLLRLSSGQRQAIGEELRDHFESRLAELVERGVAQADAVRMALEEFGDAAGLAAQFSSISRTRKRRMIMRCTVASVTALAAAVIVAMSIWPQNQVGKVIGSAIAQTSEKSKVDDQAKLDKLEKMVEQLPDDLNAEAEAKLNKFTVADYRNSPIPLTDFMDEFAGKFDLQTIFDQDAVKSAGVDPASTLVSIRLRHVRGRMLLDLVLGELNLGYSIHDGILIVSSKDKLSTELVRQIYDCREILAQDKAQSAIPISNNFDISRPHDVVLHTIDSRRQVLTMNTVSPYLHLVQAAGALSPPPISNKEGSEPITPADRLIRVITTTVEPDTWNVRGGNGAICEYAGLLVVCQTTEVHGKIAELIKQIQSKLASRSAK